jgi:hypothetical protein
MTEKTSRIWGNYSPYAPLEQADTPQEMRAAIEKAQCNSPIVRNTLMAARYAGLSAEDTYTMLAYHAMQAHSKAMAQVLEMHSLMPMPQVIHEAAQPAAKP